MLKTLKKNSLEEQETKISEIKNLKLKKNNLHSLNINNNIPKIPKLYQKKKVSFLSKPFNRQNDSSIKEFENYKKIIQTKNIFKATNYLNFNDKSNTINYKSSKTSIINKSYINTINTTSNNTTTYTYLNNTNNNNSLINIISNNLYFEKTHKSRIYHNKNNSHVITNIKHKNDDDTNINDLINDETEEKIPIHISNYNGGIKGNNRDWGLSKTDTKGDYKSSKIKIKYNEKTHYHKNISNKFKYKTIIENIKKKLLYDEKKNKKKIERNNDINYKKNNIFASPTLYNWDKIKKLNFDKPIKCIKISNSNENMKNKKTNKIPKLIIDLPNKKYKNNIFLYINTSSNEITKRKPEKERFNSLDKKIYITTATEDNSFKEEINKSNMNKNYHNINSLFYKYTHIVNKNKSERNSKNDALVCSYTIKRHKKNKNVYNCTKLIRYSNNKTKKTKNKTKNNLNDMIFEIKNIKFKHYIENYLDNKSLIILSSLNKDFYKNFRYVIYNKYYDKIILDKKSKENIYEVIKSLLKYSSKLRNKSKEEINQIYNSFKNKSEYNGDILNDLPRTFPKDTSFNKNSPSYYKLFNILTAYSNFNKQIGYAQGLNFIGAIGLSLFDTEQEVFVFLDGLLNRFDLIKYMGISNKNLVKNLEYFSFILNKYVFDIICFFKNKLLNHEFFSTNWILTLFSNCMNKNSLVVVWCFMIIFGWKFFYCFTIETLRFFKDDIIVTQENKLNSKMKNLLNNDKFEKNLNLIIKNTFQLMKSCISL